MKRFQRAKAITLAFVALAVVVVASFVGTTAVLSTVRPETRLIAANDFTITSTISSSNSTQTAALLYPGTPRYLWYTVHNPLSQPIKVLSLGVALDPGFTLPSGCDATNLSLPSTLTGTTASPVVTVPAHGINTVVAAISLINKTGGTGNQDACKNKTFHFLYSGSGQYTEVYGTSTVLASSVNPSNVGQSVTYTATVTGIVGSGQDPLPNSPTGVVTFKDGATTICTVTGVPVSSSGPTTSTASCTPPTYAVTGTHPITATYTNSDGNFTGSNASLSQVVKLGTSTALTSTPNPSIQGTSVTLSATVTKTSGSGTPTGSVSFYRGTPPTGTLLGTGTLNASAVATFATSTLPAGANSLYAVYGGNATFNVSTSPVITQTVLALPTGCTGAFNLIVGNPSSPNITGTNGNDFIYAIGANFTINSGNGNDCVQAGDGTNTITVGNGDDVVVAGNGNNTITAGNGNNKIAVGNGNSSKITVGNGNNAVTVGTGSTNTIIAGNGNNTFRITSPGDHDTITAGNGNNVSYLGSGLVNKFTGGKAGNICHLPTLPASTYGDVLVNCTAVTP